MPELVSREFLSDDKHESAWIRTILENMKELGPNAFIAQVTIGDAKDTFHLAKVLESVEDQEAFLQKLNRIMDAVNTLRSSVIQLKFPEKTENPESV